MAYSLLRITYQLRKNEIPVPAGLIGLVGEMFTLSMMYTLGMNPQHSGGRKRYDIQVDEKNILVKTKLYGD